MKRVKALRLPTILILAVFVFMLALLPLPAAGWQSNQEGASAQARQGYPVMVDGYEVFRIHQNLGTITAQQRAARISTALEELAAEKDFDPSAFQTVEEAGVTTIHYGDQVIMAITDAEAHGTGLSRQSLAVLYVGLMKSKLDRKSVV